jgi:hypothetical protein
MLTLMLIFDILRQNKNAYANKHACMHACMHSFIHAFRKEIIPYFFSAPTLRGSQTNTQI